VAIKTLCIIGFLSGHFFFMTPLRADDDTQRSSNTLKVDVATQTLAGIETQTLKLVDYHAEFTAFGKAIALQPLLALRSRYLALLAEQRSTTAKFNQATQSIARQQALYNNGISSKRTLQDQQMVWHADKARLDASQFQAQAIADEARLNWGETLADWVLSSNPDKLNRFLSGQHTLLQITLPVNKQLSVAYPVIYVEASGHRDQAETAEFIAAAPQAEGTAAGASYFFQTRSQRIRPGMSVNAWLTEQSDEAMGVIIPKSALIWSMNQAIVYIKIDSEHFSRRVITDYYAAAEGYFVSTALHANEHIVSTGGQMLLSEELRGQIPDEAD
jgi:hypothetical protein